jgi:hypothetical protein
MPKSKSKCGLVLVTGGSGYIAGYCVAQLLNDGWSVRTTVRSLAKTKAVRASIDNIAPKASEIEFVEADLDSDAGWDRAVMGAQYVLHVASPVPLTDPKDDDELIRPARDGTLRVLSAARDAGVNRVVMTSSTSAIIFGRGVREKPFTEADWTDETNRNLDKIELRHTFGATATLSGVNRLRSKPDGDPVQEIARIHDLTVTLPDRGPAVYTIEWLENLPSHCSWPDIAETIRETKANISFGDDGITIREAGDSFGTGGAAVLKVADHRLYVCAPEPPNEAGTPRSGCIIYDGIPDDLVRKKFRTALSFAFGVYLVEIGHAFFDKDWQVVSTTARSAYSLWQRAFDLPMQPLIWLTDLNRQYDISRDKLTRMVERFFAAYEELDLANLSWAYWHARAATPHFAPAHFGAAIEALQDAYIKLHRGTISTSLLPRAGWKDLRAKLVDAIEEAPIDDEAKAAFTRKILDNMNSVPQRDLLKSVCRAIKIDIGKDEDAAWKRRNKAAHGVPFPESETLAAIRDAKLLMVLFHRMLLAITGTADFYLDWASSGVPIRPLREPVPSATHAESK